MLCITFLRYSFNTFHPHCVLINHNCNISSPNITILFIIRSATCFGHYSHDQAVYKNKNEDTHSCIGLRCQRFTYMRYRNIHKMQSLWNNFVHFIPKAFLFVIRQASSYATLSLYGFVDYQTIAVQFGRNM
jgi:hypothetical protein